MRRIVFRPLALYDAADAVALEIICFPDLGEESRLQIHEVADHVALYPQGAMVAVHSGRLVGLTLAWTVDFDRANPIHTLADYEGPQGFSRDGSWLYGLDTSVHPEYRGLGIGAHFYQLRRSLVIETGLAGIVAGGMIPGYEQWQDQVSVEEYVESVVRGARNDPTLTFQLRQGFNVEGLLGGYVDSGLADGTATLLVWPNPEL